MHSCELQTVALLMSSMVAHLSLSLFPAPPVAGIKDKLAVTRQRLTVTGVSAARLQHVSKQLPESMTLGAFCEASSPIATGDLTGNEFQLTLRGDLHLEVGACTGCCDIGRLRRLRSVLSAALLIARERCAYELGSAEPASCHRGARFCGEQRKCSGALSRTC